MELLAILFQFGFLFFDIFLLTDLLLQSYTSFKKTFTWSFIILLEEDCMKGKQITNHVHRSTCPCNGFAGGAKEAPKEAKPINLKSNMLK